MQLTSIVCDDLCGRTELQSFHFNVKCDSSKWKCEFSALHGKQLIKDQNDNFWNLLY